MAEAISIAPVLLYDTQAGAEAVAVGLDIVSHCILGHVQTLRPRLLRISKTA